MIKSLVLCSDQLALDYSYKFISRSSSVPELQCSLLSIMAKTLVDKRRQRKIPPWEFRYALLILFSQGVWLCGSICILIFASAHPTLYYYPLCLFGMVFQGSDWRLNQLFNRSSRRIIHISLLYFLSFCLIKRLNSLIHSCYKLSAHKSATTANYLSRYSHSTLWKYIINFIEYVQ